MGFGAQSPNELGYQAECKRRQLFVSTKKLGDHQSAHQIVERPAQREVTPETRGAALPGSRPDGIVAGKFHETLKVFNLD
jgi:hypothetical protein